MISARLFTIIILLHVNESFLESNCCDLITQFSRHGPNQLHHIPAVESGYKKQGRRMRGREKKGVDE
jgi:hypothetical protein